MRLLAKLIREESGQDLAEYGIALAVIATAVAAAAAVIRTDVTSLWQNAQSAIASAL